MWVTTTPEQPPATPPRRPTPPALLRPSLKEAGSTLRRRRSAQEDRRHCIGTPATPPTAPFQATTVLPTPAIPQAVYLPEHFLKPHCLLLPAKTAPAVHPPRRALELL